MRLFIFCQIFLVQFLLSTTFVAATNFQQHNSPKASLNSADSTAHKPTEKKYMVEMKAGIEPALTRVRSMKFSNRQAKSAELNRSLQKLSQASQGPVLSFLENYRRTKRPDFRFESLPMINHIVLRDPEAWLIEQVSKFEGVKEVRPEIFFKFDPIQETPVALSTQNPSMKAAPRCWGNDKTYRDQAMVFWQEHHNSSCSVAISDTGVNNNHTEFEGGRVDNSYYSGEDKCFYGWDDQGHGTHCTGSIAGNNNGIHPYTNVYSCKCLNSEGSGGEMGVANCFAQLCGIYDVRVLSCSLGSPEQSSAINNAVDVCAVQGVFVVAAAGNSGYGTESWPALHPWCISVAAIDSASTLGCFTTCPTSQSNHVGAPGVGITSAWYKSNDEYAMASGTSMACPHVAGTVAMMLDIHPKISREQILSCFQDTCTEVTGPPCYRYNSNTGACTAMNSYQPGNCWGYGLINVLGALECCKKLRDGVPER